MHSATEQTITFNCPSCGTKLRVPSTMADQIGPCPVCNAMISAPSAQPPLSSSIPKSPASPTPSPDPASSKYGGAELPPPTSSNAYPPVDDTQDPPDPMGGWGTPSTGNSSKYPPAPGADSAPVDPYQNPYSGYDFDQGASQPMPMEDDGQGYDDASQGYNDGNQGYDDGQGYHYDSQYQGYQDTDPSAQDGTGYADPYAGYSQPPQTGYAPYTQEAAQQETVGHASETDRYGRPVDRTSPEPLYAKKKQFPVVLAVLFVAVIGGIGFLLYKLDIVNLSSLGVTPAKEDAEISVESSNLLPSSFQDSEGTTSSAPGETTEVASLGDTVPPDPAAMSTPDAGTPGSKAVPGGEPSDQEPGGVPGMTGPSMSEDSAGLPSSKLAAPRKTIQQFLQAATWEERLPYIYKGEELKSKIRDYHATHEDAAILDYRLDFFHTEVDEATGHSVFVFFLTFAGDQDGFPIVVIDQQGTYGLDWELFVEFRDRHFKTFVEEQRKAPESFRVVIWRVTYWPPDRDQIPDVDSLICYRIDPPYSGFTQFAFVPKDTERGQSLLNKLSWQADPLAAEVEMHWEVFPNGRPYLTIDRILSTTWVKP